MKMMTYLEANSILYTKLEPDERCISRLVGEDNYAVFDDFISKYPTLLFPDNRLMPVEAMENEQQPSSCFLPFDDMTMTVVGYNGDPDGAWFDSGDSTFPGFRNDIVVAGWIYNIDRIIIGDTVYKNTSAIITEQSTQPVSIEADWLKINLIPEPTNIDIGTNHYGLFSGNHLCWTGIEYLYKELEAGAKYREATVVITAKKNNSIWSSAEAAATAANLNMAEDVCSTFHITVRERAGQGGDNGTGKKLAKFNNISSNGSITLTCNSTANTELDLAVFGTGSSGNNGYWSNIPGYEAYNIDTTPYDYTNVVTFGGSNNSKTITISPHALDNIYGPASSDYESFYIAATWSKCANSQNGRPPQPVVGTCNITVTSSDSFVTNNTAAGEAAADWENNNGTFSVDVKAASALNFISANLNQISERGSCILQVRYRIGDDQSTGIHDLTIKRIDVPFKYSQTYSKPVFYPSNFTWPSSESDAKSRNYNAKAAELNTTATVTLYSKFNGVNADSYITMCDVNGNALANDNSTYIITEGGRTHTITKSTGCNIKAGAGSFTIAFDNVIKSGSTDTKYFKIEQKKNSVRASVGDNISPEYAIIGFTFNE